MKIMSINYHPITNINNSCKPTFKGCKTQLENCTPNDIYKEYDIKSQYLSDLRDIIDIPENIYKEESLKLKLQREHLLKSELGEFEEDDEDPLERFTY